VKSTDTADGFIPGLPLGRMFFSEAARPIIESVIPADSYAAAFIRLRVRMSWAMTRKDRRPTTGDLDSSSSCPRKRTRHGTPPWTPS